MGRKNITKKIKCDFCKNEIDLTNQTPREITGFNKKFIEKINLLMRWQRDEE